MASFDANCLLRLFMGDIPKQTARVEKRLATEKNINVTDMAIMEVVYVMERSMGLPRALIGRHLLGLMEWGNISCNRVLFGEVLFIYKTHPKLSFVDICLSVYAKLNKAEPLLTFDQKMISQLKNVKKA